LDLIVVTTIIDAFLVGSGLDYIIKQLPARKRIGIVAYSKYFLASDLANGRFWYIPLGISAYIINVVSAIVGYLQGVESLTLILLSTAAICSLIHALGTSQAAPTGLSVSKVKSDDVTALTKIFDKFSKWTYVRGIVGVPMFIAMLWALVLIS